MSPDLPIDGRGLEISSGEESEGRLAAILNKPEGSIPTDLTYPNVVDGKVGKGAFLAGTGSFFRLEIRPDTKDAWRAVDWVLVPYVHPVSDAQRPAFRQAILNYLQIGNAPETKDLRKALLEALTKKATALVEIYGNHFAQNHNVVSMSLYSGPDAAPSPSNIDHAWHLTASLSRKYGRRVELDVGPAAGWMSTGDSMLREEKRRKPWRKFYSRYEARVGLLTLPHHGSIHNFHAEILEGKGLLLDIVTTVQKEARVAGIRETLEAIARKGQIGTIVDDQFESAVTADARRLLDL